MEITAFYEEQKEVVNELEEYFTIFNSNPNFVTLIEYYYACLRLRQFRTTNSKEEEAITNQLNEYLNEIIKDTPFHSKFNHHERKFSLYYKETRFLEIFITRNNIFPPPKLPSLTFHPLVLAKRDSKNHRECIETLLKKEIEIKQKGGIRFWFHKKKFEWLRLHPIKKQYPKLLHNSTVESFIQSVKELDEHFEKTDRNIVIIEEHLDHVLNIINALGFVEDQSELFLHRQFLYETFGY